LLIPARRAHDPLLEGALRPLIGSIDIDHMRQANMLVDRSDNKLTPAAAAAWLAEAAYLE
jgi:osmoprotectant transport system permease protein